MGQLLVRGLDGRIILNSTDLIREDRDRNDDYDPDEP